MNLLLMKKKDENEIDENLLQELRINNEQLMSELSESKNKCSDYLNITYIIINGQNEFI